MSETLPSNLHALPRSLDARNLPSHVQSVLLEAILSGVLSPGQRLLVDEVAEHFGVSKIPVREALKALEVAGWVEIKPRRGTYVAALSETELHEAFELRRVLEPYSARMAARRRSEAHLRELQALVDAGVQAVNRGDVVATTDVNSRFHSVMALAVGNSMLSETVAKLEFQLRRYFTAVDWQRRRESMAQHKAIFEAIRDRNEDAAERLTLAHLDHTESSAERSVAPGVGEGQAAVRHQGV